MTEQAKQFIEKLSKDEALKAELTAAIANIKEEEQVSAFIEFTKKKGYSFTKEDFAPDEENIKPEELDTIVGAGMCSCYIQGSGGSDNLRCSCNVWGAGHNYGPGGGFCVCEINGKGASGC